MNNLSKSLVAVAAFALACLCAVAAPTIVSPADYETVSAMSPFLKSFKDSAAMVNWQTYRTEGTAARLAYEKDYKYTNGFIRLEWSGTSGPATVAVTRVRDGAVVFTATTSETSALFTDPEIGRNYSWTVTDGASSATGHFYVERNAPRIIAYKGGDGIRHLVNGRDMGGWTNTAGKVVRQGRIYRSAMTELCSMDNPKDAQDRYQPLDYVRYVLGIKLDVDLRATSDTWLGIFINDWTWTWPQGLKISPIAPGIPRFHPEDACGASFQDYGYANAASTGPTQTAKQNRAAVWHTFTNFCQEANMPLLFHCMWGKDRTGTLGYILLGLLGVPRADLNRDWGLSWYAVSNESFELSRWEIDDVYTFLQNYSGSRLADKCESYLLKCASDAGVGAATAQALINQFKALMLEDPEPKFIPAVPGADYVPPSIVEPADYATISTMSARMKAHLANADFLKYSYFKTANTDSAPNQTRIDYWNDYATNSVPTVLSWNGSGGPYTVKLWRTHVDSAATPVYVKETTEPEAVFFDLEVGRNYTWTVTDGISTATGHFFTERNTPRIVNRKPDPDAEGGHGNNTRDMGGWTGANGKVVRQSLIFRSAQLEDCNASNDAREKMEIDHLKYYLGIRFDIDFRTKEFMETFYTKPPEVEQSTRWSWTHARPVIDMSNIGADIPRYNVNKETGREFPSSVPATGSAQKNARIAHWAAFTNLLAAAERPVLFHCSEGKDRTGAFGLVVSAILGVSATDAKKDYGLTWFCSHDCVMSSSYGYKTFDDWVTRMGAYDSSATTLQAKCRAFLLQCAADAGDAAGAGDRIDAFIDMMLEDPETADTPPPAPNDNHTIICYGDSVTRGSGADTVTMDGRTTYFGGRLAGVAEVAESYPYWLSGMLSETYDVINQSRGSTLAAHVSSWAGVQDVSVKSGFTLPRSGSVTLGKKFVFDDSTYGNEYGGIPSHEKLGGFVPPIYPLSENYAAGTTSDSIVGTLGGHRVRIQGASTSSLTVTALDALSADVAIAAGTKFIPESATVEQYTNAVRIICMGGNDWIELRSGDYGNVDAYTYTYNTHIRPLAMKIKAQGGRFLVVSPVFSPLGTDPEGGELDSPVANEVEALMAADFGANYLNMRLAFVQNIDRLAQKFGIAGAEEWAHSPSAFRNDQVHLTSAGYRIKAALVREKLIELGYVTEVDRPEYTTTFPYDGTEKQCVAEGSGYVIGGTYKATAGGTYQAQVSPAPGYTWTDGTTTPVVINWLIDVYSVKVSDVEALLQNHVYNGTAQSCGLASNAKYTVGGDTSRTDTGTYSVTVTLNDGYTWDDDDPARAKTFTWTIAKAANSWVAAPSISQDSWTAGAAPALTYSVGTPASGTAVNVAIAKNGAAFDGTLAGMASWTMGFYNVVFSVAESANYGALVTNLQVTVLDAAPPEPLDTTLFDTHPEWGYKVENLGAGGDEVALVFTNQAATASWTVSAALENVQFLVVGGGGGGGADLRTTRTYDTGCGGGGGGGGGVVTGLVNFARNSVVSVTVGHGGSGGRNGVSTCHKTFRFLAPWWTEQDKVYTAYGDAGEAADSSFSVGGLTYVTAYAGGGDQGGKSNSDSATNLPEDGGSGAGARCGALDYSSGNGVAYYSAGTKGSAIDDQSLVPFYQTFGTSGGANKYSWGGSGGGGAVTKGADTYTVSKRIRSTLSGGNVTRTVRYPGAGGEGLASAITGTRRVYGSGGGGGFAVNAARADATESQGEIYLGPGIGALGGTGAGNGNQSIGSSTVPASGTSGVANQGGGGGGAGLFGNGGSGGSGIVVFRFVVPEVVDPSTPVDPDPPAAPESVFVGHPEWGYAVPGLGADGNEVALVFTNQAATISFAAPGNYTNVAFLVVGGGGGGGGDNKDDDGSLGGAGGGGGGVVTGVVYRIAQNATVSVTVGAGGAGGEAQTKPGSSYSPNYHGGANPGAASVLKVDGVTYVTADGGGRDQGVNGTGSASPGTAGGPGGSSAGSRPLVTARGVATKGAIGSSATSLLSAVLFGEQGGAGNASVNYAAGGGGGATEEGGTPSDYHFGGKGGEGLGSDITGTPAVYGSGGGGGTAVSSGSVSSGGTGAGNGGKGGIAGTAGAANLGGGGGGGGGENNGGAGGSGIVVLRVRIAEAETPDEPDQPTPPTPPAPDYDRESALTIVSPSDYATIATKTPGFKSLVGDSAMLARSAFASANTAARTRYYNEYTTNSMPVALQWTAAAPATFTVKVWRTKDVEANPAAEPLFTAETEATSVLYYDPEVGRNYTWTVSDGTSVATGHFFTEAGAPRVLYADHNGVGNGADCYNGRDLGGWSATGGKVVRQGRVYRSAELDLCGPTNRFGFHTELPYLRDQIGIRLEMDLRNVSEVQGYLRNTLDWQGAVDTSCISPSIPRFNVEASCGTKFQLYDTAITAASVTNKYRKGVWSAFTNFCDEAKMPIVFHCAHGKDRAGTLGAILLGVLGVDVADVRRDFGLSWYHHKAETMDSGGYGYDKIDAALANLATYAPGGTLAEQAEAYLIQCALYSGVSAATAAERIAAFRTLMLEDHETAQSAPASSEAISGLAADATYVTYPEPKFTVSGSATLGSGTARVLVRYSLNSGAFDQTAAVELQPDGTFSLDIPYAAATNELVWFVEAEDFGGDGLQIERTAVSVLGRARDAAPVTYTWTGGAGDGKWTSLANWTCDAPAAYGYPLDASAAVFPAAAGSATIDLEGGTYSTSLSFADGAGKVGFRNGTLLIDAASAALGATGTAVEFGGVTVGNPSGTIALTFPGGLSVRDGTFAIQGSASLGDVVFTDGEAEARLSASGSLTFNGTCAMALKDAGRTAAFIEADAATAGSACTFELDVTDRSAAGNVPLATFASSQSANLSATLATKIAGAAVANRGSLVWDGATLCYAQERQTGTATVPAAATGLVYNGAEQTGVPAGEGYTLSGTSAATAAGTYTATATLKDGYSWAGQASGAVQVQWSIARGTNAWSPAPSISAASWAFGATPGVLTPGRTAFGEATATFSRNCGPAEAFSGTLPEEPGAYTITYAAPEATADYAAPAEAQQTVSFRIIAEPSGFDAYACYTTYPATFKIIGRITPGSGETSVTVRYSLNSDSCGETMQAEISPSGSFVCEIPYANAEDSLTWRAEATASDVDTVLSAGPATITRAHDASRTCYTWTGAAGDNRWTNIGNWSAEKPDCYGYPGFYDAGWVTYVQFDRSTAPEGIDLEGGKYAFIDNGAFIVVQDITVKMKNGTLYFAGPDGGLPTFNDETVGLIGASGTSLVFENVKLDNLSSRNLIPAAGSTLVFEGANATPGGWKYNPTKANTKFVVRNGTLSGNAFGTGTIAASHVVEISNAVWSATANIANAKGLAPKVIFRDGPDREAQFITTGSFLTYGQYDIRIPAAGRALPAVKAKSRTGSSALTFDIDVTDYLSADRVPLFQFTSATAQTMPSCTLNVTAGGVDVKAARNASLVFESNTLYYKQDEQSVAPQPEPIEVTLFDEHPEWGYKVEGLGAGHDETALVFTNQAAAMSWTVPADLENIRFLVVGGGGGGGADVKSDDVRQAGAGGGGGGVVTGLVAQVSKDAAVTVAVGAGGAGGVLATKRGVNYGAAADGGASSFAVGGVTYITALGGGGDRGSASQNASGNAGGAGGSSAGSRPGSGTQTAAASTASCVNASALANIPAYGVLGNAGGAGNTVKVYDYYWNAGGGGGATEPGGDAALYDENDWDVSFWGGKGGEGLASDITGTTAVYGSGGGGGSIYLNEARGGTGGTGAGNGNLNATTGPGSSALPNQGGGGGGGGRKANGGSGGSGIVVLRFRVPGVAPTLPQVAGEEVDPAAVFTKAKVSKAIVYPSEPTVTGEAGSQVISFGGVDVNVPDYYTATLSGTTVTLALNDNAKPVIADEDETPGIVIVDGKVHIHLGNVKSALYYTILTATSLDAGNWTPCGSYELGQDDFEYDASGATRFYKASVRDEAE